MSEEQVKPIIDVRNLSKYYGPLQALANASFRVNHGEIIALLGPNGAGKTTMMKILTGFMEPSAGEVKIDGIEIQERKIDVQRVIGYLPENAPIYKEMLVQEYLQLVADLRGIEESQRQERLSEAVGNTGLEEVLTRPIGELSKGFRQRVGLAQAILHRPKLLILDEPTNGLDPTQIVEIRGLIKKLARNATVLLSTHILSEAEATCNRAIIIAKGQIKADARIGELSESSGVTITLEAKNGKGDLDRLAVSRSLESVKGVKRVSVEEDEAPGFYSFHISGDGHAMSSRQLALQVFQHAKSEGWQICELRPQSKNLEHVFKELV